MAVNERRRVNSIARRIHRSWQRRKFWLILAANLAAVAVCFAAFLYVRETEITGEFAGWGIRRALFADDVRLHGLRYVFTWQGTEYTVQLESFRDAVVLFGRPLLLAEAALWLLGFFGGKRGTKKLLKPLDRMAQAAQRLTEAASGRTKDAVPPDTGVDEDKFHDLESAIGRMDMGDRLSTGDKDLKGLEDAINDLLSRMQTAYHQQTQFVSDASHELRTPLSVIQGYVNMLDRWGKDDEKVLEESIAAIKAETAHMKALVEQLLFLARGDSGRQQISPEDMDLARMMDEVLDEYRLIDPGHEWVRGRMESAPVTADPMLVKQAARILTDNAVRYTPQGERISFRTGTADGCAYLEVQDSGIGIDEKDVPHIFDRFYRADTARDRESGGTGLGLAIARWIAEKHGGWFEVTSRPGLGTRMRMVLPAREAEAAEQEKKAG